MRKKLFTLLLSVALTAGFFTNSVQSSAKASVSESLKTEAGNDTTNDISAIDGDPEADRHLYLQEDSEDVMKSIGKRSLKTASQSVNPYTGIAYTHSAAFDGMNIYNGIDVS